MRSSTVYRLLKHLPKHEWVSTMHFTRWSAKSARTKRGGRKAKVSELAVTPIAVSGVSCYKKRPIIQLTFYKHTRALFFILLMEDGQHESISSHNVTFFGNHLFLSVQTPLSNWLNWLIVTCGNASSNNFRWLEMYRIDENKKKAKPRLKPCEWPLFFTNAFIEEWLQFDLQW